MSDLIGEFECRIDPKGRVAMPAGLLRQLSPEQQARFVITRGFEQHLVLYPGSEWDQLTAKVKVLNDFVIKERQFAQRFFAGATPLALDAQKRLLLSKRLLDYAAITDTLIISARPNALASKIDLWEPSRYEQMLATDDGELAQLAQEVMGNKLVIPLDQD